MGGKDDCFAWSSFFDDEGRCAYGDEEKEKGSAL